MALALFVQATPVTIAEPDSPDVISLWYSWGDNKFLGSKVWIVAATNLTMKAVVSEQDAIREEITEFRVGAFAPGPDPYPNGTNPTPFPTIYALYDTSQIIQDPSQCVPSNNSVGFECNVPRVDWRHQALEIRFLRILEFDDSDGSGGFDLDEPIASEKSLANPSLLYDAISVDALNETQGFVALPLRLHYPDTGWGEIWEGWVGQSEEAFDSLDGLRFRIAGNGPPFLNITAYQWLSPRSFQSVNVTPFQVKLDLEISSYPFASPTSRLALEVNVTSFRQGSATDWQVAPWPDGQGIGADVGNTSAIFLWSEDATVDGSKARVVGTVVPRDALSRHVFLSYPHAEVINHDPVMGIEDRRLEGGPGVQQPLGIVWVAVAVTLAAGAAGVYFVVRRKR